MSISMLKSQNVDFPVFVSNFLKGSLKYFRIIIQQKNIK